MRSFLHFPFSLLSCLFLVTTVGGQDPDMDLFGGMEPRSIGPAGMSGRVTTIDVNVEDPDIIYVGTASGGLWKTKNGGTDWKPLFDDQKVSSIGAVTIHPNNPSIIWVGTGEGNPRNSVTSGYGIYKSMDGGDTWECMGLKKTRNIHRILIDPHDPDVIHVGAIGSPWGPQKERGLYKSTDAGRSWEKTLYVNKTTGVADLVMDPKNPNKMFAAMWEHRRWPWFFHSGGEGSGLYVTHDQGRTWKELDEDNGLPEGPLGRIGLAIAPSDPDRVYALVEAEKNALYRSDDGGKNFRKVNDDDIGGRPFYYADIYVDPKNENRVYNLYSRVSRSEDGGGSFEVILPYSGVHPDHHAFWIHPEDPSFMIDGNDGGLNISRDKGEHWRFIENLPLAQYYHINVDNELPYNVYGGMQDNGSWKGPAYVWRKGGIRNSYWQELYFGDGFDVVPDRSEKGHGYAMSQGGNLARYDLRTGHTELIKPVHPGDTELRFNWNAPIAQDPFDPTTIYYGSQFVHKSENKGASWEIISPDLTTNDSTKQRQEESGGLTKDVTDAENYTTLTSISPSPIEKGLIWVGSDDGLIHVSSNGSSEWNEVSENIKDAPDSSWVQQIQASKHDPEEAFLVLNDYRRNNWETYVYKTPNRGKDWQRIADGIDTWGPARCIVQDPEVEDLLFLGTENGLYFSLNKGKSWTKWTNGYPPVPTKDLVIHPREHDLVIGTFGRSAYILDDIRPLQELAEEGTGLLDNALKVYEVPPAYLVEYKQGKGSRFTADAYFQGENRPYGAMITFSVDKPIKKEKGKGSKKAMVHIKDREGDTVRTMRTEVDTGMNRFNWRLRRNGVRFPRQKKPQKERYPAGPKVIPGSYKVLIEYGDHQDSSMIKVEPDPRIPYDSVGMKEKYELLTEHLEKVELATKAADRIRDAKETVGLVLKKVDNAPDSLQDTLKGHSRKIQKGLDSLYLEFKPKERQGIYRPPDRLHRMLGITYWYLRSSDGKPNQTQKRYQAKTNRKLNEVLEELDDFFNGPWEEYRDLVENIDMPLFKDRAPLAPQNE